MNTEILGEFGWLLLTFAAAMLILAGVVILLKNRYSNRSDDGKNYYEHFESPNDWSVSALRSRIDKIRNIKEEILVYSEDVGVLADETCAIMKTVEEKYIQNASQLKNEEDYQLPREEQDRKVKQRQTLAKARFADQQAMYSAVNGKKPLLECFYASNEDVNLAEAELNQELNELEKILDTTQVKAAALKKEKAAMSLGFSMNYLTDAVKSMESEKKEGFYVELTGPTLIARADELLGKAASMKQELKDLNALVEKENDMIKIINSRTKKESKGGNPAERDTDMMRLSMG
jgi:hypothetical protein